MTHLKLYDWWETCDLLCVFAIFPFLYLQADYAFGYNFVEASTKWQVRCESHRIFKNDIIISCACIIITMGLISLDVLYVFKLM